MVAVTTGYLSSCCLCLSLTVFFLYLGRLSVNPLDVYDLVKIPVDQQQFVR